jgi:hypothetical protein
VTGDGVGWAGEQLFRNRNVKQDGNSGLDPSSQRVSIAHGTEACVCADESLHLRL